MKIQQLEDLKEIVTNKIKEVSEAPNTKKAFEKRVFEAERKGYRTALEDCLKTITAIEQRN